MCKRTSLIDEKLKIIYISNNLDINNGDFIENCYYFTPETLVSILEGNGLKKLSYQTEFFIDKENDSITYKRVNKKRSYNLVQINK